MCLILVNKLNTTLLHHSFDFVLDGINDSFLVLAISVDTGLQQVKTLILFYEGILVLEQRNFNVCSIAFHLFSSTFNFNNGVNQNSDNGTLFLSKFS